MKWCLLTYNVCRDPACPKHSSVSLCVYCCIKKCDNQIYTSLFLMKSKTKQSHKSVTYTKVLSWMTWWWRWISSQMIARYKDFKISIFEMKNLLRKSKFPKGVSIWNNLWYLIRNKFKRTSRIGWCVICDHLKTLLTSNSFSASSNKLKVTRKAIMLPCFQIFGGFNFSFLWNAIKIFHFYGYIPSTTL